jgi:hypothetical protein
MKTTLFLIAVMTAATTSSNIVASVVHQISHKKTKKGKQKNLLEKRLKVIKNDLSKCYDELEILQASQHPEDAWQTHIIERLDSAIFKLKKEEETLLSKVKKLK